MKKYKFKAFCKVNLSLRVIKKLKGGYHKIQSFVTFGDLHDDICVSESKRSRDEIIFSGKFKNGINIKSNIITKLLKLLRNNNQLNQKVFKIRVKKNIPHSSGLGGGSSNAASLIKFFNLKMNLMFNKSELFKLANLVGSDVPLNLIQQNSFVTGKKLEILKLKNKFRFNILIVFSNVLCSTKIVYSKNKTISPKISISHQIINDKKKLINFLKNERNDLEKVVVKMHPKIGKIIRAIADQKGCYFSRLTGSGSACIGIFSSMKTAALAKKIIKRNFPRYWCTISKTI